MQISDVIYSKIDFNSTTRFQSIDDYFNIAMAYDVITQEFELYCLDNSKNLTLIRTFKNEKLAQNAWSALSVMEGSHQS